MNNRVGHVFGAYRLTTLLGRSAYTDAYLGEHTRVQRPAVIKLLTLSLPAGRWTAFQQTCTKASGLVHPGIVPLLDFDQQEGTAFLVQEYLPTGSLSQHCPPGAHVPLPQVADWLQRIADALSYAHSQQVLHLGLTPSNLLFTQQQEVVVSDFGLAAFARSLLPPQGSRSAQSVTYLAPEQLQGQAGPASDQYALAVCAYEWLCGALPFQGEPAATIAGHLSAPPPAPRSQRPELSAEIEQVLLTALRKQPAERFGSIQAFAHAFTQANKPLAFGSPVPSLSSAPGSQASPTLVSPTQPASAVPPAPAAPGSSVPGAAPLSSPTPPPPSWPQTPSGPDQLVLPPYPQPSQPASTSPRVSRRAAIMGAVGVGAAGVLTTLCTRTALLPFLVKSLSSRGASAEMTPTVSTNPLLLYTYRGHKSEPDLFLWSPDSTKLISAESGDNPSYHVWDALTGAHASIFDLSTIKSRMQEGGNDIGWTASGPCLGWFDLNDPPVVHVTNLASGQEITNVAIPSSEAGYLRWSPDGHYLAIGTEQIVILEAGSGKTIATFPLPHDTTVSEFGLTWSPNSNRLAATVIENNAVFIWEISSRKQLGTYQSAYTIDSGDLLWSSDSTTLASNNEGYGSTIDIWSAQGGRQLYTYTGLTSGTNMVGWSADNRLFAARDSDSGQLFVWNASTHQSLRTLPTYQSGDIIWAPDSPHLAAPGTVTTSSGTGNALIVWNVTTGQQLASYSSPLVSGLEEPDYATWSPNGKYIATAYDGDSNVYIWKAP